jgi:hypothetical protein
MLSKEVFYYFANALLKTSALVQTNLSMLSFLQPTTMGIPTHKEPLPKSRGFRMPRTNLLFLIPRTGQSIETHKVG